MVIESRYWREDLVQYADSFRPKKNPPRFSERLVVNFEKDVTLALFIVRRLAEAGRFSPKIRKHKVKIYKCKPNVNSGSSNRSIPLGPLIDISSYQTEYEEKIHKDVIFVCNQFIHANYTFSYRGNDRNWQGLYTTSYFERNKGIYRVPLQEIVKLLDLAIIDYPTEVRVRFDTKKDDWVMETF